MEKETEEKMQQLTLLEQNLQNFLMQKQNFQLQLMEIDSAIDELKNVDSAFKIVGNIMVKSDRKSLEAELGSKKETLEIRIKNIEKQEKRLRDKAAEIRSEVLGRINEDEGEKGE